MKQIKTKNLILALAMSALGFGQIESQAQEKFFRAVGTPHQPKVETAWNRYYTYEGLVDVMQKIAKAHPKLAKIEAIGKSYEGRDIMTLTITDFESGKDTDKPAMWIDGNIHSNEIQGAEFALYTAWYLTEMHGSNEFIQQLLKDKTFYITPTINPDARNDFFLKPNTQNTPRSGVMKLDNDGDGLAGEDEMDDLDGDGHITMMIRKSPTGRYIKDPLDPRRLVAVGPDQVGE
nr:peptidase M14 [Algoriphagus sp.]